jgi:exfoliative toxin A/B
VILLLEFIKKVPIPICGVALGLASLDRFLWYNYDAYILNLFALLSFILALLFTLRIVVDHKGILSDLKNPAAFAVLPTYTMTLMLLSAHVKIHIGGILGDISFIIWISAIIASFVIMFFFVRRFFFNFSIKNVYPSWVIIFVGYVVACVTSQAFEMEALGRILLWSGVVGYLGLLPLLVYRTVIVRNIPEPIVPHIAIFAAPVNLLVCGAISVYAAPPEMLIYLLTVLGVVSYVIVMCYMPVMLNRKFYPTFAALTFPLVISAASFHSLGIFYGLSTDGLFGILLLMTALIAIAIVVYVFIRFVIFLYQAARAPVN